MAERESSVSMAGTSSLCRETWAAWRVVEGVSSKCFFYLNRLAPPVFVAM